MRNIWVRHFLVFIAAVISGAVLMRTSHDVQRAEREVRRLQHSIVQEREAIRVLQAEWAYLNRPERLELLASQYLDLVPPAPATLLSVMPEAEEASSGVVAAPVASSSVRAQDIAYRSPPAAALPLPGRKPSHFSTVHSHEGSPP